MPDGKCKIIIKIKIQEVPKGHSNHKSGSGPHKNKSEKRKKNKEKRELDEQSEM